MKQDRKEFTLGKSQEKKRKDRNEKSTYKFRENKRKKYICMFFKSKWLSVITMKKAAVHSNWQILRNFSLCWIVILCVYSKMILYMTIYHPESTKVVIKEHWIWKLKELPNKIKATSSIILVSCFMEHFLKPLGLKMCYQAAQYSEKKKKSWSIF